MRRSARTPVTRAPQMFGRLRGARTAAVLYASGAAGCLSRHLSTRCHLCKQRRIRTPHTGIGHGLVRPYRIGSAIGRRLTYIPASHESQNSANRPCSNAIRSVCMLSSSARIYGLKSSRGNKSTRHAATFRSRQTVAARGKTRTTTWRCCPVWRRRKALPQTTQPTHATAADARKTVLRSDPRHTETRRAHHAKRCGRCPAPGGTSGKRRSIIRSLGLEREVGCKRGN